MKAWNNTGMSQVMVEQVDSKSIENYDIVDLSVKKINIFGTIPSRGLIEKPSLQDAPSDLTVLRHYVLLPYLFGLCENLEPGVGGEVQLTDGLSKLLILEGLNALKTDADIYDCGIKLVILVQILQLVCGILNKDQLYVHYLINLSTKVPRIR